MGREEKKGLEIGLFHKYGICKVYTLILKDGERKKGLLRI